MLKSQKFEIDSIDDIELKIPRSSKLEFYLDWDDEKPIKALLVFINGVRNADYAGYEAHLAEFAAREFEVAVLRVEYHCIGFRPETGAQFFMDEKDKENFAKICDNQIPFPEFFYEKRDLSVNETNFCLNLLDNTIASLKNQNKIDPNYQAILTITLQPTKAEYNNFGVMSALDILNAICFIKNHTAFKFTQTLLFGTSHGGYLAFLAAKFAPWLIDAVVENSGYVAPLFRLLGLDKENFVQNHETSVYSQSKNIVLCIYTKTHFTLDEHLPNYYCEGFARIRDAGDLAQLQIQAKCRKIPYISYHSVKDVLAPPEFKLAFYENLRKLGFDARLNLVRNESEIDGKFIKNLEHGMGMSMKELFKRELPLLLENSSFKKADAKKEICYESGNLLYKFSENKDKFELVIKK